jgi:hypothetical protein
MLKAATALNDCKTQFPTLIDHSCPPPQLETDSQLLLQHSTAQGRSRAGQLTWVLLQKDPQLYSTRLANKYY